jgi:hypothetical protein
MPSRSVKKRSYNQSKKRRKSRKQIGGAVFSAAQLTELGALGFTTEQITEFSDLLETEAANEPGLPASVITFAKRYLEQINPQTGLNRTPRELIDYHIELHSDETFGGKRRRKGRKQRGGTVFEEQELTELGTLGFNDDQKKELARRLALNSTVAMNYIRQSLQQINPQTGQVFTPQELIDSLEQVNNVNDLSDIESDSDDEHSFSDDDELDVIFNGDDEEPMTPPPRTEGGRRRRKSRKQSGGTDFTNVKNELRILGIVEDDDIRKLTQFYTVGPNDAIDTIRNYLRITYPGQAAPYTRVQIQNFIQTLIPEQDNDLSELEDDHDEEALWNILNNVDGGRRRKSGKTKKSKKTRKSKKTKKSRKMKGGAKYGTGVGANNFDPNYSIYNTQALNQFPYKPN